MKLKLISVILCIALLCTVIPISFMGVAAENGGYSYAETISAELGKNLYDHNFSELSAVPSEWSVVSGSAALDTAIQGGITKAGYSISGGNGNMNTVRISIPTGNFVAKLTMYQVTGYWGGDGGRLYIYKHGKFAEGDTFFETAQIQLGAYKRTSWLPPKNGAAIYKYDSAGTTSNDTATRLEDIGGGFGEDGNSLYTLYIYSYNGITYYVNEAGALLGSSTDYKIFDENYITISGDYMRILLSDFEVYELKKANILKGGYLYSEELGTTLGKNLYNHDFSKLNTVPSDWSAVSGSAAIDSAIQGGITKAGYSISGANGSMNTVRIAIPAKNFVAKLSMYQITSYWGGDGGRLYIYKHGKFAEGDTFFETAQIQLGAYKRTSWLPPKNGAAIYKYDSAGTTSNDTATRLEDIGGGFGEDGNSLYTLYIYSYNGTTYYVNDAGTLLGSSTDYKIFDENYITIAGDYMRILLSDFEVYELGDEASGDNLVLNGSFNKDLSHWIPCTKGTALSWNEEGFATATVNTAGYCLIHSNVFEVKEKTDLVFEFSYKSNKDYTADDFTVYLLVYTAESLEGKDKEYLGADGALPGGYKGSNKMLMPKTSWQNGKIEFTVPAGYSYGQVQFGFRGRVPVGDSFSVDDVKVYRKIDILDRINEAIENEDFFEFKELIKSKSAGIVYETMKIDEEFFAVLKALKTVKGEDLTANDIYTASINKVDDIGNKLELFVEESLIDKNNTTATFEVMTPKLEGQVIDLSGGFVCDDIQKGIYTGAFDPSRITEDTRPWECLGSVDGNVIKVGDKYHYYYRGVDDEVVGVDSYVGGGETLPLANYMNVCVAVSDDGINWTRPELNMNEFIYNGESLPNNIIISNISEKCSGGHIASFHAFEDKNPNADSDKLYKALMPVVKEKNWWGFYIYALESADGINWEFMNGGQPVIDTPLTNVLDSQNVVIYNSEKGEYEFFFRKWRDNEDYGEQRAICMISSKDFINWSSIDEAPFLDYYSDKTEEELIERNIGYNGYHPDGYQFYTNAIDTYERAPHIYIGMPTRYLGTKGTEVAPYLAASRDGVNFKLWDTKLIEPSAELGRDGNRSNYAIPGIFRTSEKEYSFFASRNFKNSGCIIDRFSFRVDGFVAAVGDAQGKQVVTTPVTFGGNSLVVNFEAQSGTVRAQLTDADGNVLEGFSFDDCSAITGDSIEQEIKFKGDLSAINQPVKICFELIDAKLYSYKFTNSSQEVLTGDINADNAVNAADLAILKKVIAGITPLDAEEVKNYNVDENLGIPNASDLALLKKIVAGIVTL